MHIFLTGDVQVGKSTIINKTLAALKIERPGGFRSVSVPDLPDGAMSVYLLAAAEKAPAMGDFNRVGIRKGCGRGIEKFPQAFETAGVQALKNAEQSRLILMDEVGRMESAAARFSARMLKRFWTEAFRFSAWCRKSPTHRLRTPSAHIRTCVC